MTKTGTFSFLSLLFLIPSVFSSNSVIHELHLFNSSVPTKLNVLDGSKVYLSSRDKAVALSRITLASNGTKITLDKLLGDFDVQGFSNGWAVNSDLTISTTNSEAVTNELKGELFIATPSMAQDPNFLVYSVRGIHPIDRKTKAVSTIVFLSCRNQNTTGLPNYAGYRHIRIVDIVQPQTSELFIYRNLPDDYYSDDSNPKNTQKLIFSNPLKHNSGGKPSLYQFDTIDPLQFSSTIWFKAAGGFQLTVSDSYVDTTNQMAGATTSTGMANSQLMTNSSQVTFNWQGNNRDGNSGYVVSTDFFSFGNLSLQLNGQDPLVDTFTVTGQQNAANTLREQTWQAKNLQLTPSGSFIGSYYVQYFNIDNGQATTGSTQASSSTGAPSSSASPDTSSTPSQATATPQITTPTVPTTTSSSSTSIVIISMLATLFNHVFS